LEGQPRTSSHHGYKNTFYDLSREYILKQETPIEIKVVEEALDR
jgi:hypothetical protein